MALELQPFLNLLDNYRRQHQRREDEPRQRPSPPEWALGLNPNDFKGKTREMLLAAQGAAPNGGVPIRGFDPDTAGASGLQNPVGRAPGIGDAPLQDWKPSGPPDTSGLQNPVDRAPSIGNAPLRDWKGVYGPPDTSALQQAARTGDPVVDGINIVMEEERQRQQQPSSPRLSSEQLSGMVPFDSRTPAEKASDPLTTEQLSAMVPFVNQPRQSPVAADTRQRLSPAPAQRRISPVSEPRERVVGRHNQSAAEAMDREAADVKARRDQVAREDSVHPHAGADPRDQPKHFNLRKALGPYVGGPGDFVNMTQRYRQTGELPGGGRVNGGGGTAALAGGGGTGRPPAQAAASASPAGWNEGQSPSAINASARRQMGGGLFGGNGPGLGYVLGGIGALMQEAGGRPGAVDSYVQNYGERYRQQRLTNQTRQLAIDYGVDPEFASRAPIEAVNKALGEVYNAKNAGPDYGFMNVGGQVIRTDKRGGTAEPVYGGGEGDQFIPGTKIGFDTDIGRKYSAYTNQGFSHDQALGVASGRYDLKVTDTGLPVMIDTLTNREVPIQRLGPAEIEQRRQQGLPPAGGPARQPPGQQSQAQPQQPGQPRQAGQADPLGLNPQQQKTLYQMAESGTGIWNLIGDFFGRVAPQFAPGDKPFFTDQREAVSTIQTANRGLIRALQQSPRYAEGERKSIEKEIALNPSIGMSPEAWRESAAAVDSLLRTWWDEDMQDAQSNNLSAEDRQRAIASARAIERYLQILGVPGEGQGGAGIVPGTIAVHPESGQRIRLNQNGEWEDLQ